MSISILNIGDPVPEFHLKGIDGKVHSLADLRGVRGTVLIFTELENSYWEAYEQRMIDLQAKVREAEIRFAAIFVSQRDDDFDDVVRTLTTRARNLGINFPLIQDHLQDIVGDYGVKRIPEAFLIDNELKLRYRGAIDDNCKDSSNITCHYLADAIDALLHSNEIEFKETDVVGEPIKWFESPH